MEMVNGGVETYQYDAKGRVIEITDAGGNTYVHNEYDAGNRVTRQRLLGGQEYILLYADDDHTNTYLAPANGKQIRYIYNKKKQLIQTEYPDQRRRSMPTTTGRTGSWRRTGWAMRHAALMINPAIFWRSISRINWSTSYQYDPEGNCISSRDNGGRQSLFCLDACGNLKKEIQQIADSLQREVSYEYDQYGRVTAFTDGNRTGRPTVYGKILGGGELYDCGGSRYRHTLDHGGRVSLKMQMASAALPITTMTFCAWRQTRSGLTTRYIYSRTTDLMRVIRPNHYAPDGVQEAAEHFTYDAFHNRLPGTDETGAVFAMTQRGRKYY